MSTEIVKAEERQPTTIEIIQQVLAEGGKAAEMATVIKELVALKQSEERFAWEREERQAKIDFDDALNRCQSAIARIAPNRERENGIQWLDYAGLDKVLRPVYSQEGFALVFSDEPSPAPGRMKIRAVLSRGGVSREYFREGPAQAGNSKMSAADSEASAASRLQRYLVCRIFNIAVGIDRDEKAPFEEMEPSFVEECVKDILESRDVPELKERYLKATKKAAEFGDKHASKEFDAAKKKCWGQLKEAGLA